MKIPALFFVLMMTWSCSFDVASDETDQGSYATMLTIGKYMYVVDKTDLTTFDVTNPKAPIVVDKKAIGFDIETIYNYDGVLLIGSSQNMHIYELVDGIPTKKNEVPYFDAQNTSACDPIIAREGFAYVTLSTSIEGPCLREIPINELRVYDIKDLAMPVLLNTLPLTEPKGLASDGDLLFVCDAQDGLYIYDIVDKANPQLIRQIDGFSAYDVIAKNGKLLVSSTKKLFQYDYTNKQDIKLTSVIDL